MKNKSAIVIALSFVLVGMMFFPVDTPMVFSPEETPQVQLPLQEEIVEAEEFDVNGNLKSNIKENPSFEDWSGDMPSGYDYRSASSQRHYEFDYSGPGITGNYGVLMETEASTIHSGSLRVQQQLPVSPSAYIEPGISLTLDWIVLENSAFDSDGIIRIQLYTWDGADKYRNFNYFLSTKNPYDNGTQGDLKGLHQHGRI